MKNRRNPVLLHSLSLAIALGTASSAHAADGTWNVDADGLWSTDTNWSGNVIANDLTSTANFTNNITAARTVHLDGDRTLNKLVFSDSNTATAGSWILDNNGTSTNNLILSGTTGAASGTKPVIDVGALGTNKTATISAIIQGSYGFTKNGTGTLVLAGSNTISGEISFTGTSGADNFLVLKKSDSAGTASFNLNAGRGTIKLDNTGTGSDIVFSNAITNMSGTSASAPLFVNIAGNNRIASDLALNTGGSDTAIQVDGGTLEISGNWNNTGSVSGRRVYLQGVGNGLFSGNLQFVNNNLVKAGAGTWTLSGTNTYSGTTTISVGTLITTRAASLSGYGASGKVIFNGGTVGVRVGGSGWSTTEVNTLLSNATKTSGALGIDTTNGDITQWTAFTTTNLGANLGLTKLGANTLTLDQTNTYNGATTVSAGTLKINGGSISSSDVTVNGGVLASGSTGTIGKIVTVNSGATLAAGGVGSVGAASVASNLNFSSGSIFDWDLTTGAGNGTYDTVSVMGTLNISNGAKFNVVSSTAFSDGFWNASHTWSNIFGGKAIDDFLVSNFLYSGSATAPATEGYFTVSGANLTWTAVPEPTSALVGLLITAGLFRRRARTTP